VKHLAMVLLSVCAILRADPEAELLEKLYAKLAASFSSGQALGMGGDYLLLANPGLPISKDDCADAYAISMVADQIPVPARNYRPSGALYSATYGNILDRSECSNFESMADRDKARQARRAIYDKNRPGQPTVKYRAYLDKQAAWAAAQDALTLAQTERLATGKAVPAGLDAAVKAARKDWEANGNKKEIEDTLAALDTYYSANVKALFTNLYNDFSGARRSDGHASEWYPVTATPPPQDWLADSGWKPFTLTQDEASLAKGGAALPLGAKAQEGSLSGSVSIALETKRVGIARPWLDKGIFSGHGWRLQATGFKVVSTGQPADPDPGLMPLLVTGVLLSRKLVLTGTWQSSGGKALGPFALSGAPAARNGQMTQTVDSPQILGFFCTPVPKSPDPDEKAFRTK